MWPYGALREVVEADAAYLGRKNEKKHEGKKLHRKDKAKKQDRAGMRGREWQNRHHPHRTY